ncbi:hypothetical protein K466DRAFT_580908 [Polyporus arcularius HHB13444]|uniref:WW domain-containing protein n=1 Tax=Polyporus arcularius HHB13444 TaxID=1314778 RepID=A0A5C3PZG8_9APHY|nr:hypothetical protein K466DRAFT_580908 [Polyporus arcularius HHB13444]
MSDLTSEISVCEAAYPTVPGLNDETCHETLPAYSPNGSLVPMIPRQNNRYERATLLNPEYIKIPRGLHTALMLEEPPYIAQGWTVSVNPEGSPFYIHRDKHLITDDPIQQAGICDKIMESEKRLSLLVETEGLKLPDDYECYITCDAESDKCKYYYVDYSTQTVFWLEEIDPERHDINMAPVCSVAQMKHLLQEQYWLHNEYFPYRSVPSSLRKELVAVFRQGRADQLTSTLSTFPYDAQQCKQFLQVIDVETDCDEYMTWTIARLFATIARHRYHTFFGEDHARISRDQKRFEVIKYERTFVIKLISALLFNLPKTRLAELNDLAADDVAYAIHWREFAVELLRGWRDSSYLSAGLLMIAATSISRPNNPISAALGSASVVLALGGLVSSGLLLQWYAGADTRKFDAPFVATHLGLIICPRHGYEPMAQAYSLPRALVFWSIIFLALHMLSAVVDLTGLIVQAPAFLLAGIFVIAICQLHQSLRCAFAVASVEKEKVY